MDRKWRFKRKKRRKWLGIPVIIFFVWILGNILIHNVKGLSSLWENVSQIRDPYEDPILIDFENIIQDQGSHNIFQSSEWKLIVVNRWNVIPEDYSVTLTELSNGQKVDSGGTGKNIQ